MRRFFVTAAIAIAAAVGGCSNPTEPTNPTPPPVVPPGAVVNTPPTITSVRAQGLRSNEPPNFADLSEEIDVSVAVTDAESAVSALKFTWSAPVGTFSGSGAAVKWTAPASAATPTNVTLSVEIVETYTSRGTTAENKVTGTTTVRLHNSVQEVTEISQQFLRDFSNSSLDPPYVMRNFQPGCHGTAAELSEVEENRMNFQILEHEMGPASTTVNFGGLCAFRRRSGDACSRIPMEWRSRAKRTVGSLRVGQIQDVRGVDQLVAVYDRPQQTWKLCDSDWDSGANSLDESIRGLVP
jgi:hypothetical protein